VHLATTSVGWSGNAWSKEGAKASVTTRLAGEVMIAASACIKEAATASVSMGSSVKEGGERM